MSTEGIYIEMGKLIDVAQDEEDGFNLIWFKFWNLNKEIEDDIDYCDPDTTYKEDIMARYNAIGDYLHEK